MLILKSSQVRSQNMNFFFFGKGLEIPNKRISKLPQFLLNFCNNNSFLFSTKTKAKYHGQNCSSSKYTTNNKVSLKNWSQSTKWLQMFIFTLKLYHSVTMALTLCINKPSKVAFAKHSYLCTWFLAIKKHCTAKLKGYNLFLFQIFAQLFYHKISISEEHSSPRAPFIPSLTSISKIQKPK